MKPMTLDQLWVKDNPNQTLKNVTRYLYQELGDVVVTVPAYYLMGNLNTVARLAGSASVVSSRIYGDVYNQTGQGDPWRSLAYGIPLGLMSALALPFEASLPIRNADELKGYVHSLIMSAIVGGLQDEGERKVKKAIADKLINKRI